MAPKGEFEIEYFGGPNNPAPCGGVNYASPYTAIPPNDLAPGSVNTQNINGFLCSSPWVASYPIVTAIPGEYILGICTVPAPGNDVLNAYDLAIVVTNIAVYLLPFGTSLIGGQLSPGSGNPLHVWAAGELNTNFLIPGEAVCFVTVNGITYFTGLMINGIWAYPFPGVGSSVSPVTNYVCGRFISELAGRMVVSQCSFPGGGGTGLYPQPTVAWSGVGVYGQMWDGNPLHDVWNPLNLTFFSGNIGGFNLLGDVPDQITGMGMVGQSIIIVRQNGLTQQDPNSTYSNSGIQPYNWYHMWSSNNGVGGWVGTVAQYGQILAFRSSDNVYTLSMTSGLTPIGNKIIPKIIADAQLAENSPGLFGTQFSYNSFWNFASIYDLDGQLHYLLTFSTLLATGSPNFLTPFSICYGYDLNLSDGSWHFWDFGKYFKQDGTNPPLLGFSCPLIAMNLFFRVPNGPGEATSPRLFFFGAFTGYGY